jgi:hypothetical protein
LALLAALDGEPETIPALLVAAQRFFCGHPFSTSAYEGLFGVVRRVGVDRRYTEAGASQGLLVIDLEARRARYAVRGMPWRRTGWLYYHDGEGFTCRRVAYRIPEAWQVQGSAEDRSRAVEWNEGGPEPFQFLLPPPA